MRADLPELGGIMYKTVLDPHCCHPLFLVSFLVSFSVSVLSTTGTDAIATVNGDRRQRDRVNLWSGNELVLFTVRKMSASIYTSRQSLSCRFFCPAGCDDSNRAMMVAAFVLPVTKRSVSG
jgi:hypothetical protein